MNRHVPVRSARPGPARSLAGVLALLVVAGSAAAGEADPQADPRLEARNALAWEALRLREAGKTGEAVGAAERMLAVEREVFGEAHEDFAGALEFVAGVHSGNADFEAAQDGLRRVLAIREKVLGAGHWLTTDTRYALERVGRLTELNATQRARYLEGVRLIGDSNKLGGRSYEAPQQIATKEKAAAVLKEALGESHPEYALYVEQLGWLYRSASQQRKESPFHAKAAAAFRQALQIRERALGEGHPDVAKTLESLVDFPDKDDGPDFAPDTLRRALEIRRKSQGEGHPDVARVLTRLASLAANSGGREEKEEAVAHCERALAILEAARGEGDPQCLPVVQLLGRLYHDLNEPEREEQAVRRRIAMQEKRIREERSPFSAAWIGRLGTPPDAGSLRFAHRWSAFAAREVYASSLGELARLHGARGDVGRAGQFMREAMNVYADNLDRQAAVTEGQARYDPMSAGTYVLAMERFLALSLDPRAEITADEAYRQVLSWKGGYFAYQLRSRRWRDRPEVAALVAELQEASTRLAGAALSAPAPEDKAAWDRIIHWMGRRDRLESEIADRVSRLSAKETRERPDVDRLKAALDPDVALVDFKVYATWKGWDDGSPRGPNLLAFVVRREGPVVRLDLGPWSPVFAAISDWRLNTVPAAGPVTAAGEAARQRRALSAAEALRRLLWEPLEPHLAGVGTLLVAPDSALCKFPMAALPGSEPGSFLIEDLAVAVVPVPQLLATGPGREAPAGPPGLLAVGDVDFNAEPGAALSGAERSRRGPSPSSVVPRARQMKFDPLASTGREADAVRARFRAAFPDGVAVTLRGTEATEGAFRKEVPRSRFIHLATHGFFEPPELAPRPARTVDELSYWSTPEGLVRLSPGLLSGVAFAGANRPPSADRDDGILTAVEAQQLDLGGVDMVVLSACETALGSESRGEGLMGLQRAFQVAGARTLVSSLWPVDDAATSALMGEFYTNLWQKRLPRLEALRQAQIAVLRRYDPDKLALRPGDAGGRRLSPDYWAAFILSGDWR